MHLSPHFLFLKKYNVYCRSWVPNLIWKYVQLMTSFLVFSMMISKMLLPLSLLFSIFTAKYIIWSFKYTLFFVTSLIIVSIWLMFKYFSVKFVFDNSVGKLNNRVVATRGSEPLVEDICLNQLSYADVFNLAWFKTYLVLPKSKLYRPNY